MWSLESPMYNTCRRCPASNWISESVRDAPNDSDRTHLSYVFMWFHFEWSQLSIDVGHLEGHRWHPPYASATHQICAAIFIIFPFQIFVMQFVDFIWRSGDQRGAAVQDGLNFMRKHFATDCDLLHVELPEFSAAQRDVMQRRVVKSVVGTANDEHTLLSSSRRMQTKRENSLFQHPASV